MEYCATTATETTDDASKADRNTTTGRVLAVDDDAVSLMLIVSQLRALGYDPQPVNSAEAALEANAREPFPLIISDLHMGEISGVELCRRLRQQDDSRYVYFILLTGDTDPETLAAAIEVGVDDVLNKPVQHEELRLRLRVSRRIISLTEEVRAHNRLLHSANQNLLEANQDLTDAYQTIERDLQAAANIQQSMLPPAARFDALNIEWLFNPSHFLAGDTLDYFQLDEDHVGFYLLDVAGHGTPAALQSFTVNKTLSQVSPDGGLLKTALPQSPHYRVEPPHAVIAELNRRFSGERSEQQYFTIVYGLINTTTGQLQFTQAGHPPPLHYSAGCGQVKQVGANGFPVGMFEQVDYDTQTLQLCPGDRLFIYSDGVTECNSPNGEQFGDARLTDTLQRHGGEPLNNTLQALASDLQVWRGGDGFQDDVTVLGLEWRPVTERE